VRTVYELTQPLGGARVKQRVVVWHGIPRVDCEADLERFDGRLWREFRLALPLALEDPALTYHVPLGTVEIGRDEIPTTGGHAYGSLTYDQPCRDIHPREVQDFVDASDARGGLTMSSSVAVFDWIDPTGESTGRPVLQPVLLASRRSCHGLGNWYPQAGDHHYRFPLTSHRGDWREGRRRGVGANHPLVAVLVPPGSAPSLPPALSFASVSAPDVVVSTIKRSEDGDAVAVRLVESAGRDAQVLLDMFFPLAGAARTNLIEEEPVPLPLRDGALATTVGHHAVETFLLRPAPPRR
jgi:alpha-mannosidase